jgi:hypothetical protein
MNDFNPLVFLETLYVDGSHRDNFDESLNILSAVGSQAWVYF